MSLPYSEQWAYYDIQWETNEHDVKHCKTKRKCVYNHLRTKIVYLLSEYVGIEKLKAELISDSDRFFFQFSPEVLSTVIFLRPREQKPAETDVTIKRQQ